MNTRSLSDEQPLRTWAGKGSGASCHMCGRPIKAQEIEYEVELPPEGAGRCLRFHFDCYRVWDAQVKTGSAPDTQQVKGGSAPACAPRQPPQSD
jgi:hypothetical protein